MRVKMTDTVREPRQPRRLEKKRNTWVGSLGTAVTHGMDRAGPDDLPAQRDRRWLSPHPANRNLPEHAYLSGCRNLREYRVTLTYDRPPAGHVIVDQAQEL